MHRCAGLTAALTLLALPLAAQQAASTSHAVPPAAEQIAQAVLPLPDSMRAGARVFGYDPDGRFTELRPGTGTMTCLANNPRSQRFQVACYHNSMEEFMARGRELRAQGVTAVDSVRNADVLAGRIHMPPAASLYSLNGGTYDPATNTIRGARPLYVVYLPFATEASTGISTTAVPGRPWLMHPGLPGAHIMYMPGQ
jgi:hypothetical protein